MLLPAALSNSEMQAIKTMRNLGPEDFKVIYQRHCLLERKDVTHEMLTEALWREVEMKAVSTGIGF